MLIVLEFLLASPQLAFSNPDMVENLSSNIYEAKKDGFSDAVPQAAMAGVVYCQRHKQVISIFSWRCSSLMPSWSLKTYRGCVTNGEIWVFFVFNSDPGGVGGTVSISDEFAIQEDLSGLPLVLGLLHDWVSLSHKSLLDILNLMLFQIINSKEKNQLFFNYVLNC